MKYVLVSGGSLSAFPLTVKVGTLAQDLFGFAGVISGIGKGVIGNFLHSSIINQMLSIPSLVLNSFLDWPLAEDCWS